MLTQQTTDDLSIVGYLATEFEYAHRIRFEQVCDLVIDGGVVVQLLPQRFVLCRDVAEELCGITQQPAGDLGMRGQRDSSPGGSCSIRSLARCMMRPLLGGGNE